MNNEDVVNAESERVLGRSAQRNNILAARVISETVKTTLGPRGMDKMLVDRAGGITVTNDGVTILEEMEIEHPAAKMVVEIAKTQEKEVGDGTTTAVMLAGKLLENAEALLDKKIHPTVISKGYRLAAVRAQSLLRDMAIEINSEDELEMVAQTAMTGKGAEHLKEKFSQIIVEAVKVLNEDGKVNLEDIRIEKQKGESLEETSLIKGIVLDQERCLPDMPSVVEEAKIALIEESLEVRSPEMEAKINLSSPEQMQSFIAQEDKMLRNIVEQIKASGANVVFCQKGIDDVVQFYLVKEGIFAVRRVPKSDLQAISKAVGGRVISKLSELSSDDLGYARGVEEVREDDDGMIFITGCSNPRALTILVRGTSYHVMDEIERAIRDALGDVASILSDSLVLAGAGAVEMELSKELKSYAQGLSGREQLAVLEFADAMEFVPLTLAENAGLDPIDVLTELRSAHDRGDARAGINLFTNKVEDCFAAGILEPLKVKTQAISSATEVAIMILRIDDVIAAKKKGGASLKNAGAMAGYD